MPQGGGKSRKYPEEATVKYLPQALRICRPSAAEWGVSGQIRLRDRPACSTAISARSICSSVWSAVMVKRILLVAGGTVGGRIAGAYTPCARSACARFIARSGSPTITGRIGLSDAAKRNPSSVSPCASRSRFRHKRARRCGSCSMTWIAAVAAAALAGGGAVV